MVPFYKRSIREYILAMCSLGAQGVPLVPLYPSHPAAAAPAAVARLGGKLSSMGKRGGGHWGSNRDPGASKELILVRSATQAVLPGGTPWGFLGLSEASCDFF